MQNLTRSRATDLLADVSRLKILVIGDVMLDVYLRGHASRISSEAPVPVVRVDDEWRALGGAANVAANLAALGAYATIVGVVGPDHAADEIRSLCRDTAIDTTGVLTSSDRPTTTKTRVLVGHRQVARYDHEADHDITPSLVNALREHVAVLAEGAHAIVLEDYDKGVLVPHVIDTALAAARRLGIPVVVDPKARRFFAYPDCTVFKPNVSELATALRAPVLPDDPDWMERTRRHLRCDYLLVTLGAEGMALAPGLNGEMLRIPAVARAVYDVAGAGDTVTAVVAAAVAAGGTVAEGAVLATHAAGVEVGKAGVATVSREEILASIDEVAPPER